MRAIHEEKCTSMAGVVLVFREILAHPDRHRYDLSSLQCAILGGTTVPPQLMRQVETELGIRRTCQAYGMTESGCFLSSSFYIACDDDRRYTSIGRCMPHVELKIVDNEGRTVPIGCEGEIWARGYSIMRGYYGDREQTAKMITDAAWLRTGDLGTMDQDGQVFHHRYIHIENNSNKSISLNLMKFRSSLIKCGQSVVKKDNIYQIIENLTEIMKNLAIKKKE
ncbi:unnamed protein product [Rotaria sp. Silwood1]|nr:unnamed protein product [Rotaria sp. Silwood1]CAF4880041.1 unnamed protein product [Rotaria sp. Silwood1]